MILFAKVKDIIKRFKPFHVVSISAVAIFSLGFQSLPSNTATPTFTPITPTEAPTEQAAPSPSATALPIYSGEYVSDQVIIGFTGETDQETIQHCFDSLQAQMFSTIETLNAYVINLPAGQMALSIANAQSCTGFSFAEPNYIAWISNTIPSDAGWGLQYGLLSINAPAGWNLSTGSAAVTIAIIDTGVDLGHTDLAAKIVGGYDFVNNDAIAQDDNGHGTHVAGIAAASSNNGIGIAGVSWHARIMPIKVLNAGGSGSFADVADGIIWAADNGAHIINLSLGGSKPSVVLKSAVDYAHQKGVTLVASSGNASANFVLYPARYPNVIAVSASDESNNPAILSNYGTEVDVAAPGINIYSTVIGSYGYKSGTSMSAPFVAGLAAILRGIPVPTSPDMIAWQIKSTARDIGPPGVDVYSGYGLIQMDAAIQLAMANLTPLPPNTATATPAASSTPTTAPQPFNPGLPPAIPTIHTTTMTATATLTETATPTTTVPPLVSSTAVSVSITPTQTPATIQPAAKKLPPIAWISFLCLGLGILLLIFAFVRRRKNDSHGTVALKNWR